MKKYIFLIIPFILIMTMAGCFKTDTIVAPKNMSPEETVQFYFEQWNNKNKQGMESVVCDKMKGSESELGKLNYVTLISCVEETDKKIIGFNEAWYSNAFKTAKVDVEFDINYTTGSGAGFSNGKHPWQYYLAKENENSDWIIVQWGMG